MMHILHVTNTYVTPCQANPHGSWVELGVGMGAAHVNWTRRLPLPSIGIT